MYKWLAVLSAVATPLSCVAAPQATWVACDSRPENFVTIESSSESWPMGKIVVLEGFIGSVESDTEGKKITLKV
jgi:hypothetical protein